MAKNRLEILQGLREVATKELDALPETLAAMNPDKRALVAIKLLSMTIEARDVYKDDEFPWSYHLPTSREQAAAAAK